MSYVLTIYHILDENINIHEDRNIDLLMNPSIMSEILNEDKWNDIKNRIASYRPIGYKCDEYNESSSVISSWSAVAVIEKGEGKKLVEKETGIPIFSVVKLDVIDGKVVIEKTIED